MVNNNVKTRVPQLSTYSPRAEADLIARNDQMSNAYFWKGTTMGQLKMGI